MDKRALGGVLCNCKALNCHLVPANTITDFPGGKDLSGTRNSIKTAITCAGCKVKKENLSKSCDQPVIWRKHSNVSPLRSEAVENIRQANEKGGRLGAVSLRARGENVLKENSLSSVRPFHEVCPFIDGSVHPLLDAHRIFGFERRHDLPIGVQEKVIDATLIYLRHKNSLSSSML